MPESNPRVSSPGLDVFLESMQDACGRDLSGYRVRTVERRLRRRMQTLGIPDYGAYADYLAAHPEEVDICCETILIQVTSFFRDPVSWAALSSVALTRLAQNATREAPLRVWSAGCATGEEAYTLAMLLADHIGTDELPGRVKIFATDVSRPALDTARSGIYSDESLRKLPDGMQERYFTPVSGGWQVQETLRRPILFGRHDLMSDPPLSRQDLIVCRNTLMYFRTPIQDYILARFHFSLRPDGILFVGRAEMLAGRGGRFTPIDWPHRLFVRSREFQPREYATLLPSRRPPLTPLVPRWPGPRRNSA